MVDLLGFVLVASLATLIAPSQIFAAAAAAAVAIAVLVVVLSVAFCLFDVGGNILHICLFD